MPEDHRTTELDPELLMSPFRVRTRWRVLAGAPSCGKTTLIDRLAARGFATRAETARQVMRGELARGRTLAQLHADGAALQRTLAACQLTVESQLPPAEPIFLDGALPGSLAWYRAFGLDPNQILPDCFQHHYEVVFVLDRLELQHDGFRFDDDSFVGFLDEWHRRDYAALGYQVVRVPVMPPDQRLALVLGCLAERGLL